jgi:predicted amidophosphoribosyltransferase
MQAAARMEPPVKPWVVMPVPLHEVRKRQRGFDQAEVIAQEVGKLYCVPVVPLLERVRKTAPQARREARQVGEMDEVFAVVSGIEVPKFVLLCDDVFTSGATMDAAARVLKEAGAQMVWGFVLGKGA